MERLIKVGKIIPKHSTQVKESRIGIGFEKLDRDVFDPNKAYDKVGELGVKWVRIQSGWERTEKVKGQYDFTWLDDIVDNLISRGLRPWMCVCYGHGLYDERAAKVFGSVGCPPIHTQEQRDAWIRYVKTLTAHYQGRINYYEVWNEPDGLHCWKHGVSAEEYGEFVAETAKAIKEVDKDAKVVGGAYARLNVHYVDTSLSKMAPYIDAVSFHEYTADEQKVFGKVKAIRALCNIYNPDLKIIQGESGSQSRSGGAGALKDGAWTPRKQAKQLLRHSLVDLMSEVEFMSYFSCMDMIEALRGDRSVKSTYLDYGYFGVLGAEFDENGFSIGEYAPKPSYYALQNLASMFAEEVKTVELPVLFKKEASLRVFGSDVGENDITFGGFRKPNGSTAMFFWVPTDLMTTEFESTFTLQVAGLGNEVKLVDPMDGSVYKLPENMVETSEEGHMSLKNVPIKDYPMALVFGDYLI